MKPPTAAFVLSRQGEVRRAREACEVARAFVRQNVAGVSRKGLT